VVQPLALREQVLVASLATAGVVAGIALKAGFPLDKDILLLIPWLSLPFTMGALDLSCGRRWFVRIPVRETAAHASIALRTFRSGVSRFDWRLANDRTRGVRSHAARRTVANSIHLS
jgi:hypothetical protein